MQIQTEIDIENYLYFLLLFLNFLFFWMPLDCFSLLGLQKAAILLVVKNKYKKIVSQP